MMRQQSTKCCITSSRGTEFVRMASIGLCVLALTVPVGALFRGRESRHELGRGGIPFRFLQEGTDQPTTPYAFTVVDKTSPTPTPSGLAHAGLNPSPTFSLQPTIVSARNNEGVFGDTEHAFRPAIEVDLNSGKETRAPFQPLKFAAVPVGFDILLETQSTQALDEMAFEAKAILENHLLEGFKESFADAQGVIVRSVDLTVKALATNVSRRDRMLANLHRFLQHTRDITLEARGVAGFQVNRDAVDTTAFLDKVNNVIDQSVEPQTLTALFQNSTSGLSDYRVASVTNTENPPDTKKKKPTVLQMVFAFILIALAAAGLCAYAYIFWKKRQKRLNRRKQFGVGHKPPTPTYKVPPRGQSQMTSISSSKAEANAVTTNSPTLSRPTSYKMTEVQSSSSESSYKGLGSESDEEADPDSFAKELRLAASMDKRAWNDFERRRQELAEQGHIENVGNILLYDASTYIGAPDGAMAPHGIELETRSAAPCDEEMPPPPSAVGLTVTGDTVSLKSASSFPYGDEQDLPGYLPAMDAACGILQDSRAEGHWDAYMGAGEAREELKRDSGWRMTDAASAKVSAVATNRGPPQYSFVYHSEKKFESEEDDSSDIPINGRNGDEKRQVPISSPDQTSVAVRGSTDMSNSWNTNQPSRDKGTSFERTNRSAVPALTGSGSSETEEESTDGSLLLKEVELLTARLAAFERRKEDRLKQNLYLGSDDETDDADHRGPDGPVTTKALKTSSTNSLTEKTSSGESPEKRGAKDHSPSEDEPGGIESIPSSEDSSDMETMESDGFARRLGINPFSVQIPGATQHVSKRPRTVETEQDLTGIGGRDEDLYLRSTADTPPLLQNSPSRSTGSHSPRKSALNSLRHGDAILDDWDSNQRRHERTSHFTQPQEDRNSTTTTPRRRSQNSGFNNIVNMFESKEKAAIFPPDESWQFNY